MCDKLKDYKNDLLTAYGADQRLHNLVEPAYAIRQAVEPGPSKAAGSNRVALSLDSLVPNVPKDHAERWRFWDGNWFGCSEACLAHMCDSSQAKINPTLNCHRPSTIGRH